MNRHACGRRGFTVLEVVASITILLLLSAAIAAIFDRGNRLWSRASGREVVAREARDALRWMACDIREAMVGEHYPFVIVGGQSNAYLGAQSDSVWLVSSRDDGVVSNRSVQVVWYGVVPAEEVNGASTGQVLVRRTGSVSNVYDTADVYNIYWASNSVEQFDFSDQGILAEHVGFFLAEAVDDAGRVWGAYDSRERTNQLPASVSLVVSLFDKEGAERMHQVASGGGDAAAMADRHSYRYSVRATPRRRWSGGYLGR
jgi:prepilin-type N-terminal cleavage/methylation domain-containing protein